MTEVWDEARVQQYIDDGIEESLNLDYKAARALAKTDGKRREITKDVSAMANSDGGIIIYGIAEDTSNRHLPGKIESVDRKAFSKEWLEHVIGNIRPRIDGLRIHPVSMSTSSGDVTYVVEIPQCHTAHQAMDKKYYKRHNFESVPMDDYEIKDVMNRQQHPQVELKFRILRHLDQHSKRVFFNKFEVEFSNIGNVYARYVVAALVVPCGFLVQTSLKPRIEIKVENESFDYCEYTCGKYR